MKNTSQNQYFPANAERMGVHCLESGCIGKYIPPLGSVRIQYAMAAGGFAGKPCLIFSLFQLDLPTPDYCMT